MEFLTSEEAEKYSINKLQQKINEEEINEIIQIAEKHKLTELEGQAWGVVLL
jgi:hypothetical protein